MKNVTVLLYTYFARLIRNLSPPCTLTLLARSSGLYLCDWKIRKKSEPISNLENWVRISFVWCGKQDLNLHEIAFTRT